MFSDCVNSRDCSPKVEEIEKLIKEGADVNQQNTVRHACNLVHIWYFYVVCRERERAREGETEKASQRESEAARERDRKR